MVEYIKERTCIPCFQGLHENCEQDKYGSGCNCWFCDQGKETSEERTFRLTHTCGFCLSNFHNQCQESAAYKCECKFCGNDHKNILNNLPALTKQGETTETKGSKTKVTTTYGGGSYSSGSYYSSCKHDGNAKFDYAFEVKLKDAKHPIVFLGSKRDYAADCVVPGEKVLIVNGYGTKIERKPPIVFCDIPEVGDRLSKYTKTSHIHEVCLDWKDQAPPPVGYKFWLEIADIIREGQYEKVICCCMGGHGRTGTALTALYLCFYADSNPRNAVNIMRRVYCSKAVESQAQAEYINKMVPYLDAKTDLKRFKPLVAPDKKVRTTKSSSSSTAPTSSIVTSGSSRRLCDVCQKVESGVFPISLGSGKEINECSVCWNSRTKNGSHNVGQIAQEVIDRKYPKTGTSETLTAAAATVRPVADGTRIVTGGNVLTKKERRRLRKQGLLPVGKQACRCGAIFDDSDKGATCGNCGHLIGFGANVCTCAECSKEANSGEGAKVVRCGNESCGLLFDAKEPRCPRCINYEKAAEKEKDGLISKICRKCQYKFFPIATFLDRSVCFSCVQMTEVEAKSLRGSGEMSAVSKKQQIGFTASSSDETPFDDDHWPVNAF